jgi:FeS assembly SUF system regulator
VLRIGKLTDYSIVLLSCMAKEQGHTVNARGLAESTGIGQPTVMKLLKIMTAHGLLHSVQGRGGGYRLARPARQIPLTEIIEAVEGPIALTECNLDSGDCGIQHQCNTRPHWMHINNAIREALNGVTLEQLIAQRTAVEVSWTGRGDGLKTA